MSSECEFEKELESAINRCSQENASDTPDFILATYLKECLLAFNKASRHREKWYGKELCIGNGTSKLPSERSIHIAARVWCDQDMGCVVMDTNAAVEIAVIIDKVIKDQSIL